MFAEMYTFAVHLIFQNTVFTAHYVPINGNHFRKPRVYVDELG